jgi:4-amino-4-deoxychorismate lyase
VRVRRCTVTLSEQPALAGVKHLNRLENVLARSEWSDSAIAEGLLCDAAGRVVGGTMTNLFIVDDAGLATPALTRCGVAGVTRDRVIAAARSHGVQCTIRDVTWAELIAADEKVLVNTLIGAWPVREIDGRACTVARLARAIQGWLESSDEEAA